MSATADDIDGDSLKNDYETNVLHTSPYSADSDGDGWTDYAEAIVLYVKSTNTFNPLIADEPSLDLEIASAPQFYLLSTNSENKTTTTAVTSGSTQTIGKGTTSNTSLSFSLLNAWGFAINGGYSGLEGLFISGTADYNGSFTKSDGYSFAQNESEQYQKSLSRLQSKAVAENVTYKGGRIVVGVKLKNKGNISYKVNDVALTLCTFAPNNKTVLTSVCALKSASSQVLTLNSNSETGVLSYSADVTTDQLDEILKNRYGVAVQLAGYTISITSPNGTTQDFTMSNTKVGNMTGLLAVDYGNAFPSRTTREFAVATKTHPNTSNTGLADLYYPMTLHELLVTTQLYSQMEFDDKGRIIKVGGVGPETTPERSDATPGSWYILKTYNENGQKMQKCYGSTGSHCITDYSVDTLPVSTHDNIIISYSIDGDGDGVPYSVEKVALTSDASVDTDGDGMTDAQEIYGFERGGITFVTNPLSNDTDKDLLLDDTDPNPLVPAWSSVSKLDGLYLSTDGTSATEIAVTLPDTAQMVVGSTSYYAIQLSLQSDRVYFKADNSLSAPNSKITLLTLSQFFDEKGSGTVLDPGKYNYVLGLEIGSTVCAVKVESKDQSNTSYYVLGIDSNLKTPGGLNADVDITASKYSKQILLNWPSVQDTRREYYILTRSIGAPSADTLSYGTVQTIIAKGAEGFGTDPWYVAIDKDETSYIDTRANYNTQYSYTITPVALKNEGEVLELGKASPSDSVTTTRSPKATLTLTPISIEIANASSEADSSEYYWSFWAGPGDLSTATKLSVVSEENRVKVGKELKIQGQSKSFQTSLTKKDITSTTQVNLYQVLTEYWALASDVEIVNNDKYACHLSYDSDSDTWSVYYGEKEVGSELSRKTIDKYTQLFTLQYNYENRAYFITYSCTWVDVE